MAAELFHALFLWIRDIPAMPAWPLANHAPGQAAVLRPSPAVSLVRGVGEGHTDLCGLESPGQRATLANSMEI